MFLLLVAVVKVLGTLLSKGGEWFQRKSLRSPPFMVSAIGLLRRSFVIFRYVPSIPHASRTFYHDSC